MNPLSNVQEQLPFCSQPPDSPLFFHAPIPQIHTTNHEYLLPLSVHQYSMSIAYHLPNNGNSFCLLLQYLSVVLLKDRKATQSIMYQRTVLQELYIPFFSVL